MNPHDDTPDDIKDEEQIAAALAAAQIDAAPPDAEALARIRAQSTEAFTAAPLQRAPTATKRPAPFARARWLGAAAAVILIGFGLYSWLAPGLSGATLGQVLENLEKADTLHVRLTRGDQKLEFWHTSKPKQIGRAHV